MLDSFYDACIDEIQNRSLEEYQDFCETCFLNKWWEDVTFQDIENLIKDDRVTVRKGIATIWAGGEFLLEIELTKEELNQYYEDKREEYADSRL
jgi:hypothetical protein